MALTRATDKIIGDADGNLNLSGIITASSFVGSISPANGNLTISGILTATTYKGDGSELTGVSGLGTGLTNSAPGNKIYYTDDTLSIGATVTVDPPPSSTRAYTQYADIKLEDGADLIVGDGDDFIADILDLATEDDPFTKFTGISTSNVSWYF